MYEKKNDKKQLDGKFELMHCVWNSDLKASQKNLLNYLLALADAQGECFPNTDQLAKVCGIKNQRRLTAVVDQLPGLVSVTVKGRKNYYKVDLNAVRNLDEKEVVVKVTPPTGANTPPTGAVYPPNGGADLPLNGGAYTTSNTTLDTTLDTTVSAPAGAVTLDSVKDKSDKDNEEVPALRAAPDSLIVLNDDVLPISLNVEEGRPSDSLSEESPGLILNNEEVAVSPIVLNEEGAGGAAAAGAVKEKVTDKWKKANGVKVIETPTAPWDAPDYKPAPVKKEEKPKCEKGHELLGTLCWECEW